VPFVFTLDDGRKVTADDLTLDEAVNAEAATGDSWLELNPLQHAAHCRALLVELYARAMPRDDAVKKVGALGLKAAIDSVDWSSDDDRPIEHNEGIPVVDPKEDTAGTETT
jgi:hypothetical protein